MVDVRHWLYLWNTVEKLGAGLLYLLPPQQEIVDPGMPPWILERRSGRQLAAENDCIDRVVHMVDGVALSGLLVVRKKYGSVQGRMPPGDISRLWSMSSAFLQLSGQVSCQRAGTPLGRRDVHQVVRQHSQLAFHVPRAAVSGEQLEQSLLDRVKHVGYPQPGNILGVSFVGVLVNLHSRLGRGPRSLRGVTCTTRGKKIQIRIEWKATSRQKVFNLMGSTLLAAVSTPPIELGLEHLPPT